MFKVGDRVLYSRVMHGPRWRGVVVADRGRAMVQVRFDDGAQPVSVSSAHLVLEEERIIDRAELVEQLRQLRTDPQLGPDSVDVLNRAILAVQTGQGERGFRVRVAAEIDRLAREVEREPFDAAIARQPRVRQWFASGARWSLQRLRERADEQRETTS